MKQINSSRFQKKDYPSIDKSITVPTKSVEFGFLTPATYFAQYPKQYQCLYQNKHE